ncbi:unnamed protein product [Linum trigynum]|uniref:Uncharacterized protein n=1 Tax=Linum trigynum TaxID=586398 RepID=A0AAV2GL35_9ROSI
MRSLASVAPPVHHRQVVGRGISLVLQSSHSRKVMCKETVSCNRAVVVAAFSLPVLICFPSPSSHSWQIIVCCCEESRGSFRPQTSVQSSFRPPS